MNSKDKCPWCEHPMQYHNFNVTNAFGNFTMYCTLCVKEEGIEDPCFVCHYIYRNKESYLGNDKFQVGDEQG